MAAMLVRASLDDLRTTARAELEQLGFGVKERLETSASMFLFGELYGEHPWQSIRTRVRIERSEQSVLLHTMFRVGLFRQIVFAVPTFSFTAILVMLAAHAEVLLDSVRKIFGYLQALIVIATSAGPPPSRLPVLPCHYWLPFLALLSLLPIWRVISAHERRLVRQVAETEEKFETTIRGRFRTRPLAPSSHHALPARIIFVWSVLNCASTAVLFWRISPTCSLFLSPVLLFGLLYGVAPIGFRNDPGRHWRFLAAVGALKIALLNFHIVLLMACCFILTAVHSLNLPPGEQPKEEILLQRCFSPKAVFSSEVHTGSERMRQIQQQAETSVQTTIDRHPQLRDHMPYIVAVLIGGIAVLIGGAITITLAGICFMLGALGDLPRFRRSQPDRVEGDHIWLPSTLESKGCQSITYRLLLMSSFLIAATINSLALLFGLDAAVFAIFDHTLLFAWSAPILSWLFVPFLAVGMATGTTDTAVWDFAARIVLVAIALPPLLFVSRRILGMLVGVIGRCVTECRHIVLPDRIPKQLRESVKSVGKKYHFDPPRIRTISASSIKVSVQSGAFGRRPVLLVSQGAIFHMSYDELLAGVAHELGHVRWGVGKLRLLRMLSVLGGCPPWFLLLLLDLRKLEEDADRFALEAGADPRCLATAIMKASTQGTSVRRGSAAALNWLHHRIPKSLWHRLARLFRLIVVVDGFLFTEALIGYSHPLPRDRMTTILKHVEASPAAVDEA